MLTAKESKQIGQAQSIIVHYKSDQHFAPMLQVSDMPPGSLSFLQHYIGNKLLQAVTAEEDSSQNLQTVPETQGKYVDSGATSQHEAPPIVEDVLSRPGQPLPSSVQVLMEPRFKYDFSQVRVHTGTKASESAQAVHALAYTVGHDIVFRAGQYAPETHEGQRLLAHELTHVVQQSGGARHNIERVETDTEVKEFPKSAPEASNASANDKTRNAEKAEKLEPKETNDYSVELPEEKATRQLAATVFAEAQSEPVVEREMAAIASVARNRVDLVAKHAKDEKWFGKSSYESVLSHPGQFLAYGNSRYLKLLSGSLDSTKEQAAAKSAIAAALNVSEQGASYKFVFFQRGPALPSYRAATPPIHLGSHYFWAFRPECVDPRNNTACPIPQKVQRSASSIGQSNNNRVGELIHLLKPSCSVQRQLRTTGPQSPLPTMATIPQPRLFLQADEEALSISRPVFAGKTAKEIDEVIGKGKYEQVRNSEKADLSRGAAREIAPLLTSIVADLDGFNFDNAIERERNALIDDLQQKIKPLQEQINTTRTQIGKLKEDEKPAAKAKISELQKQIAPLQNQVNQYKYETSADKSIFAEVKQHIETRLKEIIQKKKEELEASKEKQEPKTEEQIRKEAYTELAEDLTRQSQAKLCYVISLYLFGRASGKISGAVSLGTFYGQMIRQGRIMFAGQGALVTVRFTETHKNLGLLTLLIQHGDYSILENSGTKLAIAYNGAHYFLIMKSKELDWCNVDHTGAYIFARHGGKTDWQSIRKVFYNPSIKAFPLVIEQSSKEKPISAEETRPIEVKDANVSELMRCTDTLNAQFLDPLGQSVPDEQVANEER